MRRARSSQRFFVAPPSPHARTTPTHKTTTTTSHPPPKQNRYRLVGAEYEPWESALDEVPKLAVAGGGRLRSRLRELPPFALPPKTATTTTTGDAQLWRAHLVLSFLSHAYLWCDDGGGGGEDGGSVPQRLPAVLAVPWVAVSKQLDMPPVLTYSVRIWLLFCRGRKVEKLWLCVALFGCVTPDERGCAHPSLPQKRSLKKNHLPLLPSSSCCCSLRPALVAPDLQHAQLAPLGRRAAHRARQHRLPQREMGFFFFFALLFRV